MEIYREHDLTTQRESRIHIVNQDKHGEDSG